MSDQIVGNMEFRLGWSMIRAKVDVVKGIKLLQQSSVKIPDNVEILLKLAGALFQELPESEEND